MSTLSTLKLSAASPRQQLSPTDRLRRKLLEQLDLQIRAAICKIAGEPFHYEVQRWVRQNGSSDKVLTTITRQVRPWWWTNSFGVIMFSLRQGNRLIEIADGKTSVEVGELSDLPDVLETLRKAITAGELDGQLKVEPINRPVRKAKTAKS